MIPVILSGGSGSRLWPLSRSAFPKQYIALCSEHSMVQETILRLDGSVAAKPPIIVTAEDQRFLLAEHLRTLGVANATILLEPFARSTAPAIALACLAALDASPDAVLVVLPSDHHIESVPAFRSALAIANEQAQKGFLVTFGIVPTKPETGYGYIRASAGNGEQIRPIEAFVEKPDLDTAKRYVESGNYFWNSGMFAFRADVYLQELEKFSPEILTSCAEAWSGKSNDLTFTRIGVDAFAACPEDSIDYAVMERTDRGVVIPLDAGWSDVGSWRSLWDVRDKDPRGNVIDGDVMALDVQDSLILSRNKLVACLGLSNVVVVDTSDAVLVADMDRVQEVKGIVREIQKQGRSEDRFHREVHRPWGQFDSIGKGARYQVKRITVKPGERLSTQMHHHRAEHWVVVQGTAEVRRGSETILLGENESIYIPLGEVHSLANPGRIPLEIIEVQTGAYLGEDDIVRFQDDYGRS